MQGQGTVHYTLNIEQYEYMRGPQRDARVKVQYTLTLTLNIAQYEYMRGPQSDAGVKVQCITPST